VLCLPPLCAPLATVLPCDSSVLHYIEQHNLSHQFGKSLTLASSLYAAEVYPLPYQPLVYRNCLGKVQIKVVEKEVFVLEAQNWMWMWQQMQQQMFGWAQDEHVDLADVVRDVSIKIERDKNSYLPQKTSCESNAASTCETAVNSSETDSQSADLLQSCTSKDSDLQKLTPFELNTEKNLNYDAHCVRMKDKSSGKNRFYDWIKGNQITIRATKRTLIFN